MSEVQGSSTSGNQAAREGYDYEAQGYRANTGVPRGNLPTTSYIPQYTLDGSYPIQEVVPNSQYAFTSGAYLNTTAARGRTARRFLGLATVFGVTGLLFVFVSISSVTTSSLRPSS